MIGEGGCADKGGKEFVGDGLDEGFDVWGVEVVQFLEFVEIDLVGALTTKNGIDRRITSFGGGKERRGRLTRNIRNPARL